MSLRVLSAGPLTTVQDEGRPGYASWGVSPSGACDRASYRLGNRLLGNPAGTASLEVTVGGLVVRAERPLTLAVTGARCPSAPWNAPFSVTTGQVVGLGTPAAGLRSYLAVRGGVDTAVTLGSRSTDTLSGLGPPRLRDGDLLPVGTTAAAMPGVDEAPWREPTTGTVTVRVAPGPRLDRFADDAWERLLGAGWAVRSDSDRVGVRLEGPPLPRRHDHERSELPSEGVLRGAVQVPPSGRPVVFLADHPVTGGYPVVAYLLDHAVRSEVDLLAQARPGQQVRLSS